jgi:hypothetical protein
LLERWSDPQNGESGVIQFAGMTEGEPVEALCNFSPLTPYVHYSVTSRWQSLE